MDFKPSVFFEALTSPAFIDGVKVTITLTVVAMAFGLALGLLVALLRASPWAPLRAVAWGYIWVFRAIPALVWLLFVWDALPQLLPVLKGDWFSAFAAATIALAMNEAAYAAEVFRGGLLSIDEGQRLAARALGMPPTRVFSKVIAPQLIRVTIPPLSNDFITMLKLTSLASIISLQELLARTQTLVASTFRFVEYFSAAAIYYLVLVSIFMVIQAQLERRFVWASRQAAGTSALRRVRQLAALR
ncbi:MAG: amino acid ABC transporter permease [Candidatus Dormibacteraeota bacterium]|nr:amino acid ABC transporter permease [Candidatus Dormibacteraeota bacterium]